MTTDRLIKVTDPNNGVTEYTYDTANRMLTIKDARNIVYLTNEYDAAGRGIARTADRVIEMVDGKIVGAIGASGVLSNQDAEVAMAGAAAVK